MGSLASVPKISTTPQPQPQVRYVTAPPPKSEPKSEPKPAPESDSSSTPSTNDSSNDSAAVAQERETNLLRRSRGRSGTIRTSFRGLLGLSEQQQRKTLLGE